MAAAPFLNGCDMALLDPAGPIGAEEKSIIILATCLMLIVVVPVIAMIFLFAWRYRASNKAATFKPDWDHSSKIELAVWGIPCVIIAVLAYVTWVSSHTLEPSRELVADKKAVEVEVVSMDWKWLFIYPELNIASVNELAFPAGTPVHFKLTSATVMNSFFIPRLGSQIYTMPGMETKLSLLADAAGDFDGLSANYSGGGFSDMHFVAHAMTDDAFAQWVEKARAGEGKLTMAKYRDLAKPSEKDPVSYYAEVEPTLYHDILNKCSDGSTCMDAAVSLAMAKEVAGGDLQLCNPAKPRG
ncbi:cytochrome bo3 quinol oxidase subunit 2 [Nitrospirillum amazonense]|uniref:Ubiquinol oxidase subunit 2 n=1 Tax=Nitrospirillum amazonense TaxID=28077 RepID=A0A560FPQ5_9PROT|nr:ubiquinol oxidase subunit II [Nitrospirillum amazonense]TWB23597.1 cytochrome bo3 quinol oxidase subunit 2 [Nitrospirillum amazonense]